MLGEQDFVTASAPQQGRSLGVMYPAIHDVLPTVAANIIAQQSQYHLSIGFDVVYAYVTHDMVTAFRESSVLMMQAQQGKLKLVLWNELAACTFSPVCNKISALNHFIMALWGSDLHVLLLDADELVALPSPMRVPEFMQQCVQNLSMAGLLRLNMLCDTCAGDDLDLWQAVSGNPLVHYTQRMEYEHQRKAKSVLDPSRVHAIDIHQGDILVGDYSLLSAERCGQILHFINMFHVRAEGNTSTFRDWLWALPGTG